MDPMTDAEFLAYVEAHAETPRALFTPEQVERLYQLAGLTVTWEGERGPLAIKPDMAKAILRIVSFSPLCRFYAGVAPDHAGRFFDDIVKFDDTHLEEVHDYIQWLFPVPEPSAFNPWAPLLTEADIQIFKTDVGLRAQAYRAFRRWYAFLQGNTHWCVPRDHNHLRITRVIRFLTLTEQDAEAQQLYSTASLMMVRNATNFPDTTLNYWKEALNPKPSWLKE
jgi:hypothetical protein